MGLTDRFAELLRDYRTAKGFSQEELAAAAGLDRSYVGQLERAEKSPTLETLEMLSTPLDVPAAMLLQTVAPLRKTISLAHDYLVRSHEPIAVVRGNKTITVDVGIFLAAIELTHQLIDQIYAVDFDIASALGTRNLSAFVGELVAASAIRASDGLFRRNPHQDGYPDLLLMDRVGVSAWKGLENRHDEKGPFSPFVSGGIEVKATCGSVPTPKEFRKKKQKKPTLGETRIDFMKGYDWKAHHRETNNLIGVLWDFVENRPRIVAVFFSSELGQDDWGKIVSPKEGGGRTTSVSIMKPEGIKKMYNGWITVMKDVRYVAFLNKRNKDSLIPKP